MHFTACLVCDAAQARDNMLYVLGGGITRVNVPVAAIAEARARAEESNVPFETMGHPIKVAIAAQIDAPDLALVHEITVTVTDPLTVKEFARVTIGVQVGSPNLFPGEPATIAVAVLVPVPIAEARALDIRVSGDQQAGSITNTIYVLHTPSEDERAS